MDNTLFCITSMSPTLIDLVLSTDNAIVVSPRQEVVDYFSNLGIYVLFLQPYGNKTIEEVDASFKELAMPGIFEDNTFLDTDLPLWHVLSLDRLKFWYTPYAQEYINFIDDLEWESAYVSLDIGSVFPISIMRLAYDHDIPCIAVKTEPIRTREIHDIARFLKFSAYIVDSPEDQKFLVNAGVDNEISVIPAPERDLIELGDKKTLRENMKLSPTMYLEGILFDKRDEWFARFHVQHNKDAHFFVYPVEHRSSELVKSTFFPYIERVTTITKIAVLGACDKIVTFREDERYPKIKDLVVIDYEH